MSPFRLVTAVFLTILPPLASAQDPPLYQGHFPPEEFRARWDRIFDRIGGDALAVVQGAPGVDGFKVFRQSNQFYYLSGLETPRSYILLDGRSRTVSLYLPPRDERYEGSQGKILSADDAERVKALTGADGVYSDQELARHLDEAHDSVASPAIYTPFSPAEGRLQSRDVLRAGLAALASDPWDGRPSREKQFMMHLRTRYSRFEIRDLSPILDELRNIKSPREIALIRRASQVSALGIMEAMRCTKPGVMEYQLDAAAQFVFRANGAFGPSYASITAGGKNAWFGHYCRNSCPLNDGDLVLMDFGPDCGYYTSDVTRMWPVNGTFTQAQRELCGFILKVHDVLLEKTRPGITVDQVLDEAAPEMEKVFEETKWSKAIYEEAARSAVKWRGHFTHPVGMAVHDVGDYKEKPLEPGVVFALDPMMWVPEEKLYIRIENLVIVTEEGAENLSSTVPADPDEIEALMKEEGILQQRPPRFKSR